MSRRSNQPDTPADIELRECLLAKPPICFNMVAGAGSGKTTSLIKALTVLQEQRGKQLRLRRQRIACITYTEVAAGEIWADVGNDPLVHVSTIHSFLWSIVRAFQKDISDWVANRIVEKIGELEDAAANFGSRVQARTREKNTREIARYRQQQTRIASVKAFSYGTGSDYANGVLGHDDVLKLSSFLIQQRPLLRRLVAQQYPFVFVDESQDTTENVVAALKAIASEPGVEFCLGFFGDPMQRIYITGVGPITLEDGWRTITKPENFRCPRRVLDVANAIRSPVGDLRQERGRTVDNNGTPESVEGSARIFILPANDNREEFISRVKAWIAEKNADPVWRDDSAHLELVRTLVIVHRMAASRLGFGELYSALNDKAPDKFKNGFLDATAWPLRPFVSFILPVARAAIDGNDFEVMQLLRKYSPMIQREKLIEVDVPKRLTELGNIVKALRDFLGDGSNATVGDVLKFVVDRGIFVLDPRILSYLNAAPAAEAGVDDVPDDDEEELSKEISAMEAFLGCKVSQLWDFTTYVSEESPFSTQQGIKGAEFERVLVVLDDNEGTHVQFSYDKYLGIKPLSDRDLTNLRDGNETAVERTRRLFYVCCTRALKDLAVVLFSDNVALARERVIAMNIFPADSIHTEEDLELVGAA